jgi:transcription antitermination protein NusB
MASRRKAREFALQALYQLDLVKSEPGSSLNGLWAGLLDGDGIDGIRAPESAEVEFAQRLVFGVVKEMADLDQRIESCSTNWRVYRMPVVDRNILRIACLELLSFEDVPATVSINEAVELAKKFGTKESKAFVNGIADRLGRNMGRLERETDG